MFIPFLLVSAAAAATIYDYHDHPTTPTRLPGTWYHPDNHPVHSLFKRGGDGETYPKVGSPEWLNAFPPAVPDSSKMPAAWVDALNAAVSAGKIPDIPQSIGKPQTNPVYPSGYNPNSPEICSSTYKCRMPGDIWDAPAGYLGTGFDDGPTTATPKLLQFLKQSNERVTHFMIGMYIRNLPDLFLQTFNQGDDIAVHTYTHPYMTTLSNLDVVAQLGYTMAIIRNSTGGRLPSFWRPPYGDSDRRVQAIAKEVFGLRTLLWNQDTEDWSLTTGGTTSQKIAASMRQWLGGSKTPGLIILQHELSDPSVQAFIDAYPLMKSNGWNLTSVAELGGSSAYQNADSSLSDTVIKHGVIFDGNITSVSASVTSQGSSTPSTSSSSSSSSPPQISNSARVFIPSFTFSLMSVLVLFAVPTFGAS